MLVNVTHILPLSLIRRRRMLPAPGTVLVASGQTVSANDVIATTDLHSDHIMLDIARGLGVTRGKAGQYIQRAVGDKVTAGSTIASRGGIAARVVRAPANGRIVAVAGGQVALLVSQKPYELLAGMPGTVRDIEADYGATIETTGAWIQGVWGNGQIGLGGLLPLAEDPSHRLEARQIEPSMRGAIVLAGYCNDAKVFDAANKNKLRGLILGSMATQLTPIAAKMPYPVIVTEGFGPIPMNQTAFTLLSTNAEREVSINAMELDRRTGKRPEVIIPLEGASAPAVPVDVDQLQEGQTVRILTAPHMGQTATVAHIPRGLSQFPSGVRAAGVELELPNGDRSLVPVANIEVLG